MFARIFRRAPAPSLEICALLAENQRLNEDIAVYGRIILAKDCKIAELTATANKQNRDEQGRFLPGGV